MSGLVEQVTYSMRFYMGFKFVTSPWLLCCFFCPAAVLQGRLLFMPHRKKAEIRNNSEINEIFWSWFCDSAHTVCSGGLCTELFPSAAVAEDYLTQGLAPRNLKWFLTELGSTFQGLKFILVVLRIISHHIISSVGKPSPLQWILLEGGLRPGCLW